MNIKKIKFNLDFSKMGNKICLHGIRQGDANSIQLVIRLFDNKDVFPVDKNSQILINGVKPDGTKLCNLCETDDEGNIIYTLKTQDTSSVGLVEYQIVICNSIDGKFREIASPKFSCLIESRNFYPEYEVLISQPDDWSDNFNNYYELKDEFYIKLNEEREPLFESGKYYSCNGVIESTNEFGSLLTALNKAESFIDKCNSLDDQVDLSVKKYFNDNSDDLVGADGLSAYQVAVNNGYDGSEAEWLESLKGNDGVDGVDGKDGADGVSVTNAFILPASAGTEAGKLVLEFSNDEGLILGKVVGDKGDTGATGPAGADGLTPEKGVDYWTEEDHAQMVQDVLDSIGCPVFGVVDKNNVIKLTGNLPDGTYNLKYELEDATTVDIGELTLTTNDEEISTYTNLADPTSADWLSNKRLGSNGVSDSDYPSIVTNYIPCNKNDVIRIKGLNIGLLSDDNTTSARVHFLNSAKTLLATAYPNQDDAFVWEENDGNILNAFAWKYIAGTTSDNSTYQDYAENIAYVRFCGHLENTAEDVIITVNEEFV